MGIWGNDVLLLAETAPEKVDSINIVLSAYRSIRGNRIIYASVPVTTGQKYYDVLDKYCVKNLDDLLAKNKDALKKEIIMPNIEEGVVFADELAKKLERTVIAPSVFEAKKQRWSQNEYMFLWYRFIEERIAAIGLMKNSKYSNGSAKEVVRAIEMQFGFVNPINGLEYVAEGANKYELFNQIRQIRVFNDEIKEVKIENANKMFCEAINELHARGFNPKELLEQQEKLMSIAYALQDECFLSRGICLIQTPYEYDWHQMIKDTLSLNVLSDEVKKGLETELLRSEAIVKPKNRFKELEEAMEKLKTSCEKQE